jgi:predicted O-linked N-acetylglucosamine transferase (SPINDLY family)
MSPQYQSMLQQAIQAFQGGNFEGADSMLKRVLQVDPKNLLALNALGLIKASQSNYREAADYLVRAARIAPNDALIQYNLAKALSDSGQDKDALAHHKKAVALAPNNPEAWLNYGITAFNLGRYEDALVWYGDALSLKPDYPEALLNKGTTLRELKRYEEAIAFAEQALSINPNLAEAWSNKGLTLHELKRFDEAITHYDKALSLKPDYHEAWSNKGVALNELKKHSESAKCFQKALEFNAEDSYLLGQAHHQMMLGCNWADYEKNINEIFHLVNEGRKGAEPFGFQGIASSEELLKKCAEIYSNDNFPPLGDLSKFSQYKHSKIRIGYLCGEFRNQATSILMTRVWELHDESKFEIFAFDNGWDDRSEYRQRITSAFSNIFDVSRLSDLDAAKLIQHNEIDILVNLNGFFGLARQGIFSYRPAPIQVNYLGFPGTIGAPYMDYIIADKVVVPYESRKHYVEKIAYLPNSYQANDNQRIISEKKFSKAESGLPENSFIFACFNNNYKITPSTFEVWSRILRKVESSVLWLLADNPLARENLIKEATARGIASCRLVFAERLPLSEHLARHDLADLFLDTLPYNAHTTCSDALWAGLPVLTLMGHTFPGRVSSSLLSAMGLSELVTHTREEYEELAIGLSKNPQKLSDIKLKLAKNRLSAPLFDTPLFAKNLENAYIEMHGRYYADLEPDHIVLV